jgi:tripartite-type tricarboxylate transporter receptor subunit TctC
MLSRLLISALLLISPLESTLAQEFPSRPVRIVVPFPPGGGIDVLVRGLAVELTQKWGHPVIIDNRPGAGGNIGTELVAKSAPDGHTLLATVNQTFSSNRYLYKSLPYDPERSFVPISLMVQSDHFLLAHPSVPANDVRELVALAKRTPGKLTYGSFGNGSQPQLVYETLNKREGLDLLHVPYKGIAPLMTALTAGEVNLATGSAGVAGQLMRAGRMKALAIAGKRRAAQFPDVPTTAEAGYPYLLASIWYGLFAPTGTPAAVVDKVGEDVRRLLKTPAFAEKQVTARGLDVVASTSAELAAAIKEETPAVGEMIRSAGVQPE